MRRRILSWSEYRRAINGLKKKEKSSGSESVKLRPFIKSTQEKPVSLAFMG